METEELGGARCSLRCIWCVSKAAHEGEGECVYWGGAHITVPEDFSPGVFAAASKAALPQGRNLPHPVCCLILGKPQHEGWMPFPVPASVTSSYCTPGATPQGVGNHMLLVLLAEEFGVKESLGRKYKHKKASTCCSKWSGRRAL